MYGPPPTRLVGRAADGRRPDAVDIEPPLLEVVSLARLFEVDQLDVHRSRTPLLQVVAGAVGAARHDLWRKAA
jgi:hypothetical protein